MRAEMKPTIHPERFLDVSARIIGAVRVEQDANIWPMVALRADSAEWSVVEQAHVQVL
jgi:carbonic anhydrase/acetyltransferase-like protein (isoleucine patch superfamily)